ncbi:MAG: 2-amino-4-hydroxy-6-hydroxymethyldihydropteridine diphosphokinase [Shewanellaceae bacterium]|nr:2-amino-4-hydroxy-6-hydroxymethyldihydropteridine diphosphokinase [Shewanellaceae bacterium]
MNLFYVSLGSNINPLHNLLSAIDVLKTRFIHEQCSPIYKSDSVGFQGSAFFNAVIGLKTEASITHVLASLKTIEQQHGRRRTEEKFSDRTLDLDLLLFNQMTTEQPCTLPHPEILTQAYVLKPLVDIAPHLQHPTQHVTMQSLWATFSTSTQLEHIPLPG